MKIGAIIQARMDSTRLPGKVMKEISDRPMIWHVIDRVKRCKRVDEIVLASTHNKNNDLLESFANDVDVMFFRGSEEDVLGRYLGAAVKYSVDLIVRITSDCPLIDPRTVDRIIRIHMKSKVDITSNILERTYPRGLDAEVFPRELLETADKLAKKKYQREHVTPYFYENLSKLRFMNVVAEGKIRRPDLRLCVDTIEDLKLIREIYRRLYRPPGIVEIDQVIDLLDRESTLASINKDVKQKRF